MKYIIPFLLLFILSSCSKKYEQAEVIKNCTGSFLKIGMKTYKVCNEYELDQYSHGTTISARYERKKDDCGEPAACYLNFPFDDKIHVLSTK